MIGELRTAMALKRPKSILNRLVDIWPLVKHSGLLSTTTTRIELLNHVDVLRTLARNELAPDTQRLPRATVAALCQWIASRSEAGGDRDGKQVTLPPLLIYRCSRIFLDADLSAYLTETLGESHDTLRRKMNRAFSHLEEWGVIKMHREADRHGRTMDM